MDWDPLAPLFFRINHPDLPVRWLRADIVGGGLEAFLGQNPDAAVVFCNFLGQAALCSPQEYREFARRLPELLKDKAWASFHDLYSGTIPPTRMDPLTVPAGRPGPEALGAHFFPKLIQVELNEYELPALDPMPGRSYWAWPLTTRAFHIIEGFASTSRAPRPDPSPRDQTPRDGQASKTPSDPEHCKT